MAWKLSSTDHTVVLDVDATGGGAVNGTLNNRGRIFPVSGDWAASFSVPGRNHSAFAISGNTPDPGPLFLSASGIMIGPGDAPVEIDINIAVSSTADGQIAYDTVKLFPPGALPPDGVDTFDHVVVLMLENRSFDNLLGYMYPNGVPADAPLGKTFEGVTGKNLSNPVPALPGGPRVMPRLGLTPVDAGNYFQPYPDPGEPYPNVNRQLFNSPQVDQYNVPIQRPLPTPNMEGFVTDYIANFQADMKRSPTTDEYKQFMQSYTPAQVPVITTLSEQFGVFDHWFCAVPSQTWCNRAFWNAGSSFGWVINPTATQMGGYFNDSIHGTIFNQIESSSSSLSWRVFTDGPSNNPIDPWVGLTHFVHYGALDLYWHYLPFRRFYSMTDFYTLCKGDPSKGQAGLPSYSFLEPRFLTPNNDMHPSSISGVFRKGEVGSVLLGELLVWNVYEAIRNSPQRDRILLIITFDEHGGCYDHVPPGKATAPEMPGKTLQDGFDFTRLGVRVPTIMVSSHIAKNTVVNTQMDHCSFMKTVSRKWEKVAPGKFPPLTARVRDAHEFTEVFTSPATRPAASWPQIPKPNVPGDVLTRDYSQVPLGKLERSIVDAAAALPQVATARKRGEPLPDPATIQTVGQALAFLNAVAALALPQHPAPPK